MRALDFLAELFGSSRFGEDPGAAFKGRAVADVLAVAAGEDEFPVAFVVLLEAGDVNAHAEGYAGAYPCLRALFREIARQIELRFVRT